MKLVGKEFEMCLDVVGVGVFNCYELAEIIT